MTEALTLLRKALWESLQPPPKLRLSKWIEEHIHLPEGVSSLTGKVRLWPPQVEIADAIGNSAIERVTLVKPVRVGFTTLLTSAMASFCSNDPAPILSLLPTESDCRDYMVSDVEPVFDASPTLQGILSSDDKKGGRNTLLSRRFPGGFLKVIAAKSPRNLRRHNVRILFMDEVDGMTNTKEGSAPILAERRTLSFSDRKIVMGSTPVYEATSHVLRAYEHSDKRIYEVPCPECGHFHEIQWADIQWPEGEPEKAYYVCVECGSVVDERHKPEMVTNGRWRALKPEVKDHAGFRMNALISLLPNASWGRLAKEFVSVKNDPSTLQTFVNTILAQGWKDEADELDDIEISERAEDFGFEAIPVAVMIITAGVDVQDDRLEVTFIGWDKEGVPYVLGHEVIWGRYDDTVTWGELDILLSTQWDHPLGGRIKVDATCVDSSDGETMETVYRFAFPRFNRKVYAIKGAAGNRPWIERSKSTVKGGRLFIVGVDGIKSNIMGRLTRPRSMRFSKDLAPVWYEQVAGERMEITYKRGQTVRQFVPVPGRRHEALDCTVYAFAARQMVNANWAHREGELSTPPEMVPPPSKPQIATSDWL
ncbi:phage terminase large subunit family protein [Agrobacterium rosae]|uniref:phage terminase large subunit family protein n=1 Tax=Agrobacterium rosae TaxID=1972867 RepID=UPI00203458BD|nr:phage terminase large subunit family protein [Agrobacterium rosae]MCM2434142.1 phage terminase large subunit family protein [Agrobacterium rosae]